MRTVKTIKRQVEAWSNEPAMVTGVFRLLTYIPWNQIEEKYKGHFPPEAKDTWNDDLENYKDKHIMLDLATEVTSVFNALHLKNITQALSILPIMVADTFALGKKVGKYQRKLKEVTNNFLKYANEGGRELAEVATMYEITDFINDIVKETQLTLQYHPDEMLEKILNNIKTERLMKNLPPLIKEGEVDAR